MEVGTREGTREKCEGGKVKVKKAEREGKEKEEEKRAHIGTFLK